MSENPVIASIETSVRDARSGNWPLPTPIQFCKNDQNGIGLAIQQKKSFSIFATDPAFRHLDYVYRENLQGREIGISTYIIDANGIHDLQRYDYWKAAGGTQFCAEYSGPGDYAERFLDIPKVYGDRTGIDGGALEFHKHKAPDTTRQRLMLPPPRPSLAGKQPQVLLDGSIDPFSRPQQPPNSGSHK